MPDHLFGARRVVPALRRALAVACLFGAAAVPAGAETLMLSPSVMAAYYTRPGPSGLEHLEVLVLWRGQPDWYVRTGTSESDSRASAGTGNLYAGRGYAATVRHGDIELSVRIDLQRHTAEIQRRHTVDLREYNVIFVDDVDDGSGGAIVRLLRIDAGLLRTPGARGQILVPVLRAAPDFGPFLRCGEGRMHPAAFDFCAAM